MCGFVLGECTYFKTTLSQKYALELVVCLIAAQMVTILIARILFRHKLIKVQYSKSSTLNLWKEENMV